MRYILILVAQLMLSGCVVGTVARTAVDVVTLPVKVASAGVDAVTTSQAEADRKRGRDLRKQEEARGRAERLAMERCRQHRAEPGDDCAALLQPR